MLARAIVNVNPIYDSLEPIISWLDKQSAKLSPSKHAETSNDEVLVSRNELLNQENQMLREQLGLKLDSPSVIAHVTRRDLLGFRKYVWIDRGSDDGLKTGQTAITRGSLFGIVDEVYKSSARLQTILDPDFRATVVIGSFHGIMKNRWGSLIIDLVPSKNLANKIISTDGLDGVLQKGVLIGEGVNQISGESEVFGSYNVKLPIGIYDSDVVEILGELSR